MAGRVALDETRTKVAGQPLMTGIHLLLTYMCNRACDHCFVYSSSQARGTFTIAQIRAVLDDLPDIGTIETVCFEGGEPFLFYRTMVEGIRMARERGFETGIVTNAYWAISLDDAVNWLAPLAEIGLGKLSVSDDTLHYGEEEKARWENVEAAAGRLGIETSLLYTEPPAVTTDEEGERKASGGVMFRGRAAENLAEGMPTRPWDVFTECPAEDPANPGRVHVDAYGNVHICQGISMGNVWETPLSRLVTEYDPGIHPICGPLIRGGPAALISEHAVAHRDEYISACHLCYEARRTLLERFPKHLAPRQVYGLE